MSTATSDLANGQPQISHNLVQATAINTAPSFTGTPSTLLGLVEKGAVNHLQPNGGLSQATRMVTAPATKILTTVLVTKSLSAGVAASYSWMVEP